MAGLVEWVFLFLYLCLVDYVLLDKHNHGNVIGKRSSEILYVVLYLQEVSEVPLPIHRFFMITVSRRCAFAFKGAGVDVQILYVCTR